MSPLTRVMACCLMTAVTGFYPGRIYPPSISSHHCARAAACTPLQLKIAPRPILARQPTVPSPKPTAVYGLILANILVFFGDKVLRMPIHSLYLSHYSTAWWQPFTSLFCHASRSHLSGNVFLLLLFGRSVEDDLGWGGLLLAFAFCGGAANFMSLLLLPSATVSIGASGAVFGLFTVSVLSGLSFREFGWRKMVEVAVLGEFVVGKMLSEMQVAASGGVAGVNHIAHLTGAGSGVLLVLVLRTLLNKMEDAEQRKQERQVQ